MATTYTRNIRLKITDDLTADARYNINRLDEVIGNQPFVALTSDVFLRSQGDITIEPENPDVGGSGSGGSVKIGTTSHEITDVYIYASDVYFSDPISIKNSSGTNYLELGYTSSDSSDRALTFDLGSSNRTATFGGNLSLGANFTTTVGDISFEAHSSGSSSVTVPASGTLATVSNTETFLNKTLTSPIITSPTISSGTWSGGTLSSATLISPAISGGTITSAAITSSTGNFNSLQVGGVDVVTISGTQSVSNKTFTSCTIDGSANTLSNIPYSSIILSNSIINSDISSSAGIAYSKLNLSGSILNADINAAAAIAGTKIDPDFGSQDIKTTGEVRVYEGSNYVGFEAPALSGNQIWKLPTADGTANQVLFTNGSGQLDWASVSTTALNENNIRVGNSSNISTAVDTNSVGDILADDVTGLTYKAGSIVDADINASAAIAQSKLSLAITDSEVNAAAAISLSKLAALTADRALQSSSGGEIEASSVTAIELGYLSGVTSAIQTQLAGKLSLSGGTMTGAITLDGEGLIFDTSGTPAAPVAGQLWWDSSDVTLALQTDVSDVKLQVGQEVHLRSRNVTGTTISDGSVVYVSGVDSNRATIALAQADDASTAMGVIGIVTADIATTSNGYTTTFGLVRDIKTDTDADGTALSAGDVVYLSGSTAGGFTKTKPSAPNYVVKVGTVIYAHATAGVLLANPDNGCGIEDCYNVDISSAADNYGLVYDSATGIFNAEQIDHVNLANIGTKTHAQIDAIFDDTDEPHGILSDSGLSISTRTVTLAAPYSYYRQGVKFTEATTDATVEVTNTTDLYYVVFTDAAGTLATTTSLNFADHVLVAIVYVNASTGDVFFGDERHGIVMDHATHEYLHKTKGAVFEDGGAASGYVLNSDTLTDVQIALTETTFWDEDVENTATAKAEGDNWDKWYRTGATGDWRKTSTTDTIPVIHAGNVPQYNDNSWGLTGVTNNDYFNTYIFCTNSAESDNRFIVVPGQNEYASQAEAEEEENFSNLNLGDLPTPEILPMYRLTWQYKTSYTGNDARVQLVAISDSRRTRSPAVTAGVSSTHNSLSGRTDANSHPASAISAVTTNFDGALGATDDDVQTALETIDDAFIPYTASLSWSGVGPYTMTVAASTHGKGLNPDVRVREDNTGSHIDVIVDEVSIDDATGDVTITSISNFSGKIIIRY